MHLSLHTWRSSLNRTDRGGTGKICNKLKNSNINSNFILKSGLSVHLDCNNLIFDCLFWPFTLNLHIHFLSKRKATISWPFSYIQLCKSHNNDPKEKLLWSYFLHILVTIQELEHFMKFRDRMWVLSNFLQFITLIVSIIISKM